MNNGFVSFVILCCCCDQIKERMNRTSINFNEAKNHHTQSFQILEILDFIFEPIISFVLALEYDICTSI